MNASIWWEPVKQYRKWIRTSSPQTFLLTLGNTLEGNEHIFTMDAMVTFRDMPNVEGSSEGNLYRASMEAIQNTKNCSWWWRLDASQMTSQPNSGWPLVT
jgi:hypothetical protein